MHWSYCNLALSHQFTFSSLPESLSPLSAECGKRKHDVMLQEEEWESDEELDVYNLDGYCSAEDSDYQVISSSEETSDLGVATTVHKSWVLQGTTHIKWLGVLYVMWSEVTIKHHTVFKWQESSGNLLVAKWTALGAILGCLFCLRVVFGGCLGKALHYFTLVNSLWPSSDAI